MGSERRLYERIDIALPCRLWIAEEPTGGKKAPSGELRFEAYARSFNLSLGGVFLETSFLLKEGLVLTVDLGLPDGRLPIRGKVAHAVSQEEAGGPSGLGIQFLDIDARSREALLRFFTPTRYQRFLDAVAREFPHLPKELPQDRVSLLLNLWEAWKVAAPPAEEKPLPLSVAPNMKGRAAPPSGGGKGRR